MPLAEPGDRHSARQKWLCLAIALAVVVVVWVVLFVWRVQAHQPDDDDYLYAYTARTLYHSPNPLSAFLHTGQTSPLVPALAALGAGLGGIYGSLAVELPLLLLLVAGSFVLARIWVSPTVAMVVALVAVLNAEALSYALMLNFAIASTAAVIWCFAAYVRSDRFRNWRWALTFGVAMAALALSRSMAPVYIVPLVLVVLGDYLLDVRKNGDVWRWPALLAGTSLLVLAGPWWLVSGHEALHYLLNAGYNPAAGYSSRGFVLTPTTVKARISFELSQLGWLESFVLGGAVLAAVVVAALNWRRLNRAYLWMLPVWSVLTIVLLSTSANFGTAFGLPVVVVVIVLSGSVLGQFPTPTLRWAMVPVAAVVVVGLAFQFTASMSQWWPGPPYRFQVIVAGGTSRTDVGLITAQVAHAVGRNPTVVAYNDPIVNVNGLVWELGSSSSLLIPPGGQSDTAAAIGYLRSARALISGTSVISFYASMNQEAVDKAAFDDGYRPEMLLRVAQDDSIVIWRRGRETSSRYLFPLSTTLVRPKTSGTVVKGNSVLDAQASSVLGVMSVGFEISGGMLQHEFMIAAIQYPYYGWLGEMNTKALPNGVYRIRSVAEDVTGHASRSASILVRVDN